jgi:hypothetical protein
MEMAFIVPLLLWKISLVVRVPAQNTLYELLLSELRGDIRPEIHPGQTLIGA